MNSAELTQLTQLCERLGATPSQAATMAMQLLKRADQLAAERQIERTVALAYLIEVVVRGRRGEPPPAEPGAVPPKA